MSYLDSNVIPILSISQANISYVLPEKCNVNLTIYNQIGNKIKEEAWTDISTGEQEIIISVK